MKELWDRLPRQDLLIIEDREATSGEYIVTIIRRSDRIILGRSISHILDIARSGAAEQALAVLNIF